MAKKNGEGITKIAVSGFKSLAKECAIDIRPLTILAGANSSGKSSIMQPLLMLKQTLEATYDPGPLLIDGPNVQFTEAEQFLSKLTRERGTDCFQIEIEVHEANFFDSVQTIFKKGHSGIEIIKMTTEKRSAGNPPFPTERATLVPNMSPESIKRLSDQGLIPKEKHSVERSRCTLRLKPESYESSSSDILTRITDHLNSEIIKSIHLPGLRGNPERTYKPTSTGPRYPGTFENYVAGIIHKWQETTSEHLETLGNPLDIYGLGEEHQTYSNPAAILPEVLHILGLAGQVDAQKIGDTRIELQVGLLPSCKTGETDMVSIADVGLGVSQVLPVLVALIAALPGQLVYLEQPELHLHPRAQVALARVLADAAKRGVRVVAETHSSLLLLAVQTLVAEGSLSPELVKLHWFRRGENGATKIDTADLDEAGAYGDWPEDFDDVDLKAQSRYIKAAQSRLAEKT